jgi:hypothetical protein
MFFYTALGHEVYQVCYTNSYRELPSGFTWILFTGTRSIFNVPIA